MSALRGLGSFAGYFIGAVVIIPLVLIGVNYFFIKKNDAAPYVELYQKNSVDVKVTVPSYWPNNTPNTSENIDKYPLVESKLFTTNMATKDYGRDGSKRTTMSYRKFYDQTCKKYFSIVMFDVYHRGVPPIADGFWDVIDKSALNMRVNKDDMNNAALGNQDNPIPVFKVWGANKPLLKDYGPNNPVNYDVTTEQYKYNVKLYLTYVMPKSEFKKRFLKK